MKVRQKSYRKAKVSVTKALGSITFTAENESESVLLSLALGRIGSADSLLLIARLMHGGHAKVFTLKQSETIGDAIDAAMEATSQEYENRIKEFTR